MLRASRKTIERSRTVEILNLRFTPERALAVTHGESDHLTWMTLDGSDQFCSCVFYEHHPFLCEHLVYLAQAVLGLSIKVVPFD